MNYAKSYPNAALAKQIIQHDWSAIGVSQLELSRRIFLDIIIQQGSTSSHLVTTKY